MSAIYNSPAAAIAAAVAAEAAARDAAITAAFGAVKAYLPADQTLVSNLYAKITFTTELLDSDAIYDNTNSRLVIPSGQTWALRVHTSVKRDLAGNVLILVYKNQSSFQELSRVACVASADTPLDGMTLVTGNGTDYYEAFIVSAGFACTVYGFNSPNIFSELTAWRVA